MKEAIFLGLYMSFFGAISSSIGGFLGGFFNIKSKNMIAFLYELTAGMMTGIVCFEMIPESIEISNTMFSILGIAIGVAIVYITDIIIQKFNKKEKRGIIALVIMFSMAIHNAIEGLAIGSSFIFSFSLGFTVLISIFLHDIPEGMVVGITNKINNKTLKMIIINSAIVGSFVGVGAFIGGYIGKINQINIAISLSIAAGAMLYLISCQLIPESKENTKNKVIYTTYILGIMVGMLISTI